MIFDAHISIAPSQNLLSRFTEFTSFCSSLFGKSAFHLVLDWYQLTGEPLSWWQLQAPWACAPEKKNSLIAWQTIKGLISISHFWFAWVLQPIWLIVSLPWTFGQEFLAWGRSLKLIGIFPRAEIFKSRNQRNLISSEKTSRQQTLFCPRKEFLLLPPPTLPISSLKVSRKRRYWFFCDAVSDKTKDVLGTQILL